MPALFAKWYVPPYSELLFITAIYIFLFPLPEAQVLVTASTSSSSMAQVCHMCVRMSRVSYASAIAGGRTCNSLTFLGTFFSQGLFLLNASSLSVTRLSSLTGHGSNILVEYNTQTQESLIVVSHLCACWILIHSLF